jgi:hypothetical protein
MIMIFNFIVKRRLSCLFIRIPVKSKSEKKPHTARRRKYATVTSSPKTTKTKRISPETQKGVLCSKGGERY